MKTDFLVIGSGIAGLSFALRASRFGNVFVVTKKEVAESNTNYAQGGIAAVLDKNDSFESHIEDTIRLGCKLCDEKAVEVMVKQGPKEIRRLIALGVEFAKQNGKLSLGREGGHSKNRVVHVGDYTGQAIESTLVRNTRKNPKIKIFEHFLAFSLIIEKKKCHGVRMLDVSKNQVIDIFSKVTILATGGIGHLYKNTSNPAIATGDGIAMAFKAGVEIKDMEFVQFHPTSLDSEGDSKFLISETVRGEGGILINSRGEPFMKKVHKLADLAPRDVVSKVVFEESKRGQVFLDIAHKDKNFLKKRFPMIYERCLEQGIDITKDPIPVVPAAHYLCGGIKINLRAETSIAGLFAFGECVCSGVHGANRMGSNSLLESVVFSSQALEKVKDYAKLSNQLKEIPLKQIQIIKDFHKEKALKKELRQMMWDDVGIVRKGKELNYALEQLQRLEGHVNRIIKKGINESLIELSNMIIVAKLITKAALLRKESRGVHFRADYPHPDDKNWLRHISFVGSKLKL